MLAPRAAMRGTRTRSRLRATHLLRSIHTTSPQNNKINLSSGQVTQTTAPSSSRYWPKYEIPQGAPQLIYDPKTSSTPVTISWTNDLLFVQDSPDRGPRVLKPAALRDSCTCASCKDVSSGQKSFASIEIPTDIGISSVRATEPGLAISFVNDIPRFAGHEMILPWKHVDIALKRPTGTNPALKSSILRRTGVQYWDAKTLSGHVRKIDYAEFMKGESSFWDVVIDILRLGIVYLKNVPRDESSIVHITTRIANIRETFYGRTFDVRAKPNAENVAYTSGYLGLHQDLCYLDPPPMIQVLHCMDNSCSGGESLFSDGERAGRLLHPFTRVSSKMASLTEHRVPYQYDKHGYFYHADRAVIDTQGDEFTGVYWSPPFQGGYTDGNAVGNAGVDMADWIEATRVFEGLVNDESAVHNYKMEEGECVVFDNLRTMHGRNAFDAEKGGSRWLRGAYIAREDFLSRAAYIPAGQAEMYRGGEEWDGERAERELREGEWFGDVVRRVREVDGDVEV